MPAPVHIRPPRLMRLWTVGFGLSWCTAVLAAAVQALPEPVALVPLAMGAFGATLTLRLLRLGVDADSSGLEVRNYYRTRRYRWDDVEGFRLGSPMGGFRVGQVVHVLLADDTVTTLDVTASPMVFGGRAKRDRWLQQLRAWLPSAAAGDPSGATGR